MTNRWRLVNGKELYDIKQDPGQKKNVAKSHPEAVARLRAFYNDWWAELKPTFKNIPAIHLGHPNANPTLLTSHDWMVEDSSAKIPWNQAFVREAIDNPAVIGDWNVKIVEPGYYEIRLRRWPREVDTAIDAPLPPGNDVPGQTPFRATPGNAVRSRQGHGPHWRSSRGSSGQTRRQRGRLQNVLIQQERLACLRSSRPGKALKSEPFMPTSGRSERRIVLETNET